MIWFLYNILFLFVYLLMLPKFIIRMCRRGGYSAGFMQRFGFYDKDTRARLGSGDNLWVHAVSVGEMFVALKYIDEIRQSGCSGSFVITTTTSTGFAIAEKRKNKNDLLLYFPVDFPVVSRRVLSLIKPKVILLTECELWPNLIRLAFARDIPVAIINGRISDSSYRGYSKLSFFTRRVMKMIALMQVQDQSDAERLVALGADPERVKTVGSSKYDVVNKDPDAEKMAADLLASCGIAADDMIIVAGSTWPGEEAALLKSFKELRRKYSSLRLVIVPRHAERRDEVEDEIKKFNFKYAKRSAMKDGEHVEVDVLLADTTGELTALYSSATVIFVGKSLTQHGGQNFIEPAYFGKPVITGPNLENFPVVARDFISSQAIIQVDSVESLHEELHRLLDDSELRSKYGDAARQVVESRRGSVSRNVEKLLAQLNI